MKNNEKNKKKVKIMDEKFHRIINKMSRIEKMPRKFDTDLLLHPSEIHTIEAIGVNPGINVTELAKKQGVTKGAVSQILGKLEKKNLIIKMKEADNDRKVSLKLSKIGLKAFKGHANFHARIHYPLVELVENASSENLEFLLKFLSVLDDFCSKALKEDNS